MTRPHSLVLQMLSAGSVLDFILLSTLTSPARDDYIADIAEKIAGQPLDKDALSTDGSGRERSESDG